LLIAESFHTRVSPRQKCRVLGFAKV